MSADLKAETPGDDAAHPRISHCLTAEMSRLYNAGYSLIPLGGEDGKRPIVQFRDRSRLPLAVVVDRIANAGSRTYGIRLEGLLVVDVDTDTPEAREYVNRRFGQSPVRTRTARGFHLFFRFFGTKPKQVRLPGIAVDFKSGGNEFVVGPQSQRPDGVSYLPDGHLTAVDLLPLFSDVAEEAARKEPAKIDGRYPRGMRHKTLKARCRELALSATTFDVLLQSILGFRDREIEGPEDFPDGEVKKLALWFWDKLETGELWSGTNSVIRIHRDAVAKLAQQGEGLAMLLYAIITGDHGHRANAVFAIVPDGLRKSGRLKAGRGQIYAAIDVLIEAGLLECLQRPTGRRNHNLYRLANVKLREGEKEGGGSRLILVPETDTAFKRKVAA